MGRDDFDVAEYTLGECDGASPHLLCVVRAQRDGIRPWLSDSSWLTLVKRFGSDFDLPLERMRAVVGDLSSDGNVPTDVESLENLVHRSGPYWGVGSVDVQIPEDAAARGWLEEALATSLSSTESPVLPKNFLGELRFSPEGLCISLQTKDSVVPQEALSRFQATAFYERLSALFEEVAGAPPELLCVREMSELTAMEWAELDETETVSLTALLKARGVQLSAVKANRILLEKGLLEERERPSTTKPGTTKKYKVLTKKGRRFGMNKARHNDPGTSPGYFEHRFDELLETYLLES